MNFELLKLRGAPLDSTDLIAHCNSSDFRMAAGIAEQVFKQFTTTYPKFGPKATRDKVYAQQVPPH